MTSDSHQFRMALMQFVSQLAMVPVPPPGSLGIVRSCFGMSSIIVVFLSNVSCGPIMLVGSRVYILVFDFDLLEFELYGIKHLVRPAGCPGTL